MGHFIVWNLSGWSVYNISGKIRVFVFVEGDNKTNETDNEQINEECGGEEEKEEINLSKALEKADKLKTYCLRKIIHGTTPKCQVSEITDKAMNFTTKKIQQTSM